MGVDKGMRQQSKTNGLVYMTVEILDNNNLNEILDIEF